MPGRSFAGHVAAAGFDVYIADFGTPGREDRFADLVLLRRRAHRALRSNGVELTGEPSVNVVGYCLGGTLSLLYSALYPETVRRLILLTTTVDGDVEGGIAWVAHKMGLAGESYDEPRLVPGRRGEELVRDARAGLQQPRGPSQRSLGPARRRAGAAARRADDGHLGRRRRAGARTAARRAVPEIRTGPEYV